MKTQRDAYADGILPDFRINMLNKIGFNFYHGRKSDKAKVTDPWQRRLTELKTYKEKTGNTNVPKKFALNLGLGEFVYNQRMAYKDNNLPEEKIKSLEALGFDWSHKYKKADKKGKKTNWEMRFEELEEYKSKYGNLNVPVGYEPNPHLATWASKFTVLSWHVPFS